MTPSIISNQGDLFDLLNVDPEGVDQVHDHEVGRESSGPVYVTIALDRITPREQVWAVRVYSQTVDQWADAHTRLYVAVESVDEILKDATVGPSEWQFGFDDGVGALVARCFVNLMRETF